MSDPIKELYSQGEYCAKELASALRLMKKPDLKEGEYDAMMKSLGIINLYCPENLIERAQFVWQAAQDRHTDRVTNNLVDRIMGVIYPKPPQQQLVLNLQ